MSDKVKLERFMVPADWLKGGTEARVGLCRLANFVNYLAETVENLAGDMMERGETVGKLGERMATQNDVNRAFGMRDERLDELAKKVDALNGLYQIVRDRQSALIDDSLSHDKAISGLQADAEVMSDQTGASRWDSGIAARRLDELAGKVGELDGMTRRNAAFIDAYAPELRGVAKALNNLNAMQGDLRERIQALEAANSGREQWAADRMAEWYPESQKPSSGEISASDAIPSYRVREMLDRADRAVALADERAQAWEAVAGKLARLLEELSWEDAGTNWTTRKQAWLAEYEALKGGK